jgi:hypothetical protein
MEQRTSCRARTNLPATICRGREIVHGRCVELSHTGVLFYALDRLSDPAWYCATLTIGLPEGPVRLQVRNAGRRGERGAALAFSAASDEDEARLTDYLFERMLARPRAA